MQTGTLERGQTELFRLPDIQMGTVIGSPPSADYYTVVGEIIRGYCGRPPRGVEPVVNGYINKVFIVDTQTDGFLIVRMQSVGNTDETYQKTRWATNLARAAGVPAPAVYQTGYMEQHPYMISEYLKGIPGNIYLGNRVAMWHQLGEYARAINAIPTFGIGFKFDLDKLQPPEYRSFSDYVDRELLPALSPNYTRQWKILDASSWEKLMRRADCLRAAVFIPHLAHGDLIPRNVKIDQDKVVGIIDWDKAASHMAPYLELALAIDEGQTPPESQAFFAGYRITGAEYSDMMKPMTDFLCFKYHLRNLMAEIDRNALQSARKSELSIRALLGQD